MSAINDGGPAFPVPMFTRQSDGQPMSAGEFFEGGNGLSLRDWFAGNEQILAGEAFEWELCEALAGKRPRKDRKTDPLAWEIWQATWQAKIRYIRADAMLAARERKEDA